MKYLVIVCAIFLQSCVSAQQTQTPIDCNLFNRCLNTPIFASNFLYPSVVSDTISVVDTTGFMAMCSTEKIKDKYFSVLNIEPEKRKMVKDNSIIIFRKVKRDCVLIYFFFSPRTGRSLSFNFLQNEVGDYDIIGYKIGDF